MIRNCLKSLLLGVLLSLAAIAPVSAYEPSEEAYVEACQHVTDTGLAMTVPGRVGRTCAAMIEQGFCGPPGGV